LCSSLHFFQNRSLKQIMKFIHYYKKLNSNLAFYLLFAITALMSACQEKPKIVGFDENAWKKDVGGCSNVRTKMIPMLEKVIPQLVGLRHNYIIEVLGKPDGNSLEKSGQRVYYYLVEPGPQCQKLTDIKNVNKLFIQFDALDRAKYINFTK